jgi:hypothetical protein
MNGKEISISDIEDWEGYTPGQKNLMKHLMTVDLALSERVDVVLVEALDASDLEHHYEAESLFQEALDLIRVRGRRNDYMFLPVLLHYCAFLHKCKRFDEYKVAFSEFERIGALYE